MNQRIFGSIFQALLTVGLIALADAPDAQAQSGAVRDVTPSGVLRVYRATDAIDADNNTFQLTHVRVQNDGTLAVKGAVYRLFGISLPPRQKICTAQDGARWTCGQRAWLMLRNLTSERALDCVNAGPGAPAEGAPVPVTCKIGRADIALTLLSHGLAEVSPEATNRRYHDAAKQPTN
jgi:endonuclease YncB( thermonuclease family)